jgi:fatty-acyl-CoA synthase
MRNQGIGSWPARRVRTSPDRTALVFGEERISYRRLDAEVNAFAHALRSLGVHVGDRVAYQGRNHPSFLVALFATGLLGAVFVPLDPRLAEPEVLYRLADSGSTVLIHDGSAASAERTASAGVRHRVAVQDSRATGDEFGYAELLEKAERGRVDRPVPLEAPCMIMYTSGTTGRAKGAVLTHGNIVWNAMNVLVDSDLAADDVALACAPLFHAAALNMTALPTLLKGATVVLTAGFDAALALELIERERVTQMFGVPTMFDAMAAHPRWPDADLSSLRRILCGGAPLPRRILDSYLARGLPFGQGYGATEAGPGILYLDAASIGSKDGSAGVPHFFADVRVVRPDGDDAAVGERGEVLVSGPHVSGGYWERPEETAAAITPDGWFRTGDVAHVDGDGYAYVVDRVKDMIISGGENVYPAEVEDVLLAHPAVAECAVLGVPDDKWGEVGHAVVVLVPGSDVIGADLLEFLRPRLAAFKVPKSYTFVACLPRTGSGKVAKPLVRELLASHTPDRTDESANR